MSIHGHIKLIKSDDLNSWYTIEKAEHGNKMSTVMDGENSGFFYYSGRICDADIEGTLSEMKEIAKAIRNRERVTFKRCAVDARTCLDDEVHFWSPRNSRTRGVVDVYDAEELATQIEKEL